MTSKKILANRSSRAMHCMALLATMALVACDKANDEATSAAPTSDTPKTGKGDAPQAPADTKPAGDAEVGAKSVEIRWTGEWKPGDAPDEEYPLYSVTNKATAPLTFMQLWHYFYDKDKNQIGRQFTERYQLNIAPGAKQDIGAGPKKSEIPEGTEFIEAVVVGANFGSEAVKFRDPAPPEQRPIAGG